MRIREDRPCLTCESFRTDEMIRAAEEHPEADRIAVLFSGDTLFAMSYGRVDFPTGNAMDMLASVKKLLTLPEATMVYPGHNGPTTIAHEKKYNPLARY